ncbi:MAG: hypothetical protein KDE53_17295 [Caldilineaceae bacterium]|nr:hypothetical protein [Caldilineaceae bacterium]
MEYAGFIASLYVRNTGNGYDRVAQVRDIKPKITADTIDASHRDSGSWGSKLPGTKSGEMSFDLVYDPGLHDRLFQMFDTSASEIWLLSWNTNDGAVWEFRGGLSEFSPTAGYKDAMTADCTVQMQGRPSRKVKADYTFDLS